MSKAKSLRGSSAAVSSTLCLRLLLAVCWNGRYSSESGLYASASPSKIAVLATTCRLASSAISGKEAVMSSRLREKILMSSSALCTWHRKPSYFLSTAARPSFVMIASALGKRGAHGVADADAEGVYGLYAVLPQRLSHEPEVGGLVIRALESLPKAPVADPGERERVEHGRVAHTQAHPAQGYTTQVLARQRVEVPEQRGERLDLLPDAARPGRAGYPEEPVEDLVDWRDAFQRQGGAGLGCYLGCRLADVAQMVEALKH